MMTTVAEKNQVALPAELAHALNIKPGTQLEWIQEQGGILRVKLLPSRGELADRLQGLGRGWLHPGDDPVARLFEERSREDNDGAPR
ncbi:MAG: AbrB/MazE/SpoVT family DNA-binding domain-containing protein [Candidatus Competibacteraceae bacterium]